VADTYEQLLDATITHLEDLKKRGTRFIAISPDVMLRAEVPRARKPAPVAVPRVVSPTPAVARQTPSVTAVPTVMPPTPAPVSAKTSKAAALAELREKVLPCTKCQHLAAARKNVVLGVGNPEAELKFIGEAPGADEDREGEPFVGAAGQLLTRIIQTMGLSREKVYIANILKCRPDTPGQTSGNRKPTPEEMQTCIAYLHQQIEIIQPKVLVALGATAIEGLLGKTAGITRLRGNWQVYRGIPLMPTYHPAYLLRNQSLEEKRRVWEDMLQVMKKLNMPISDKQSRYFTTS
jgi:DNA polymerase